MNSFLSSSRHPPGWRLELLEEDMTTLEAAQQGCITPAMERMGQKEGIPAEVVRQGVAAGRIVIPCNVRRSFDPEGIGQGLLPKVNANLGSSQDGSSLAEEEAKLAAAVAAGAHSVMDLSTGPNLEEIRRRIVAQSPVMVGAVPLYATAAEVLASGREIPDMTEEEIFASLEAQCAQGLDYITVHCGVTQEAATWAAERVCGMVSRGGTILAQWMAARKRENPLLVGFDRLLDIARRYDVTLSLGDGLRPGAGCDATDAAQVEELLLLGRLARRARESGVQVMIEGPGHVPAHEVAANVLLQKRLCQGAPFYVLGPLVIDAAPGYDHIVAAVGATLAAMAGADFLCVVTPAEHLGLPDAEEIRQGVVAARIAAHAAAVARGVPAALARDREISVCRAALDWEGMFRHALDPEAARRRYAASHGESSACTMCGDLCAVRRFAACRQALASRAS